MKNPISSSKLTFSLTWKQEKAPSQFGNDPRNPDRESIVEKVGSYTEKGAEISAATIKSLTQSNKK